VAARQHAEFRSSTRNAWCNPADPHHTPVARVQAHGFLVTCHATGAASHSSPVATWLSSRSRDPARPVTCSTVKPDDTPPGRRSKRPNGCCARRTEPEAGAHAASPPLRQSGPARALLPASLRSATNATPARAGHARPVCLAASLPPRAGNAAHLRVRTTVSIRPRALEARRRVVTQKVRLEIHRWTATAFRRTSAISAISSTQRPGRFSVHSCR
jgi:hypothetical protein